MIENKESANAISIVKMSAIEPADFQEVKSGEWVKYGSDNMFPLTLQRLMNNSALHNAIISSKVDGIVGEGLYYDGEPDAQTDAFMAACNSEETLESVFRKCAYDYVLYGGYALNVILSKDKKKIAEIWHVDFSKLRCAVSDERGKVPYYLYSRDWANLRRVGNEIKEIPAYDPDSKEASQIIYVKEYRPGMEYYPLPSYCGALSYIEVDVEIGNFHRAHLANGMAPGMMINFCNGIPTEDERRKVERGIREKYEGTDNAGRFILTFSEDKDKIPVVEPITPADLDKQFIQLQDTVLQNILSGHKIVSPLLVGIKTPGELGGGASEIESAYKLYSNTVIAPMQRVALKAINMTMAKNGLKELAVELKSPLGYVWSEDVMSEILTRDEMREMAGIEGAAPAAAQPAVQKNENENGN